MNTLSLQEQAEEARRRAVNGSLHDFRYPHQRAEAFGVAASLFEQAGLTDEARACSWDAQLWRVGTAGPRSLKQGEQYFRPLAVLRKDGGDSPAEESTESPALLVAGSP